MVSFFIHLQVVMGRDYPEATISHLSGLYTTWAGGLLAYSVYPLWLSRAVSVSSSRVSLCSKCRF
jgi:hypothetical protein